MTALAFDHSTYSERPYHRSRVVQPVRHTLTPIPGGAPPSNDTTTSAFGANRPATWLEAVGERFAVLLELEPDWDGYGGRPIDFDLAVFAIGLLFRTLEPDGPVPQVVPLSYGGLQLEWHQGGIDLEIEIIAPNQISVGFEDQIEEREWEGELSTDYSALMDLMAVLHARHRS